MASRSSSPRSSRSISRPGVATATSILREVADLAVHRGAAVERGDAHADLLADRAQHVDDLLGELAGRDEHERRGVAGLGRLRGLQRGEAERQGLARAGLGLAAHVAAGERVLDGRGLDGEGLVDALRREGVDDLGPEAERLECGHVSPQPVRRVGGRSSASPNGKQVRDGRGLRQMIGTRDTRLAGQGSLSAHRGLATPVRSCEPGRARLRGDGVALSLAVAQDRQRSEHQADRGRPDEGGPDVVPGRVGEVASGVGTENQ